MCGIAGWIDPRGRVDAGVLRAMNALQAHRGPDGEGVWISPDARVGLGHRRLSIIDLSAAANQPMQDADGRASIVFNGEIYNHRELRVQLEQRGARFRTDHSDTEVLVVGYLHWGLEGLLERVNGPFAFAIHDLERRRVVIARDRIGIKPLHLAEVGGGLVFASEAKALFAHPALEPALDRESFGLFLSFRAVPAPRSLFRGVSTLGPGELIEYDLERGRARRRRWWDALERAASPPRTWKAARERLSELIDDAVRLRLEADVPVGLFLSGGVDSALLLARLARQRSGVRTWTVTYPGHGEYDEGREAAALARASGARHTEVPLDDAAFAGALEEVVWHQDEPIAAPVCTSVWFLSRAAREAGVPVVLAGEGSDELFIGYSSWLCMRDIERWNERFLDLPGRPLRRMAAAAAARFLPHSPAPELLRRASLGLPLFWSGAFELGEEEKRQLAGPAAGPLADPWELAIGPLYEAFRERAPASDVTGWMSYVDLRFRLPQLMLPRLDKMGMAFGVEGRVPYLDHRIAEFAMGLEPGWRGASGGVGKALLKEVAEDGVPRRVARAKKKGFRAPVREWKDGALGARWAPALVEFARRTELLDPTATEALLARSGDRRWFGLLNFALWYLVHVEQVLPDLFPEVRCRTRALRAEVAA